MPQKKTTDLEAQRAAIVDEFGRVDAELGPLKKRHEQLRKEILSWLPAGTLPSAVITQQGSTHVVQIGAAGIDRTITGIVKLFDRVGKTQFLKLCTFPLKAFDSLIPADEHKKYLKEEQTGSRKVTVVAKFQPSA